MISKLLVILTGILKVLTFAVDALRGRRLIEGQREQERADDDHEQATQDLQLDPQAWWSDHFGGVDHDRVPVDPDRASGDLPASAETTQADPDDPARR